MYDSRNHWASQVTQKSSGPGGVTSTDPRVLGLERPEKLNVSASRGSGLVPLGEQEPGWSDLIFQQIPEISKSEYHL